jgi:AcrR family transcriptional regulator
LREGKRNAGMEELQATALDLPPRDRVLRATMDIILERGLGKLRLSEIADRCGMSTGHVLYYFGTRARILIETLTWSEEQALTAMREAIRSAKPGWPQLNSFIRHYVPTGPDDARSSLWLEVWATKLFEDHAADLERIDRDVMRELRQVLSTGVRAGAFRQPNSSFPRRLILLMDGLIVHILEGTATRAQALSYARAQCRTELL